MKAGEELGKKGFSSRGRSTIGVKRTNSLYVFDTVKEFRQIADYSFKSLCVICLFLKECLECSVVAE